MIALIVVALGAFGALSWLTVWALMPALYFLDTGLLWTLFLAIMNLQRVRDAGRLPDAAIPIAKLILAIGYVADALYNLTWAIIGFLDLPREILVTQRLKRYKFGIWPATGWRLARTEWYCDVMLDPYDPNPNGHVRP